MMTRVMTRDSAQRRPNRQASVECEKLLTSSLALVPHQADRLAAAPCRILPLPSPDPASDAE